MGNPYISTKSPYLLNEYITKKFHVKKTPFTSGKYGKNLNRLNLDLACLMLAKPK